MFSFHNFVTIVGFFFNFNYIKATSTTSNIITNGNVLCDSVLPNNANFETCNQYSDSVNTCCYLSTTSRLIKSGTFTYNTTFSSQQCAPLPASSSPYPQLLEIAGLVYNVKCPTPISGIFYDQNNSTFSRGTQCGPNRAYSYDDCKEFNLLPGTNPVTANSCCLAKLVVDTDFEVNSCFFYGTQYDTVKWKNIVAQERLKARNNDYTYNYLYENGTINYGSGLSNETIYYFGNFTYNINQIGFAEIYCKSIGLELFVKSSIIMFIIILAFFD